MMSDLIHLYEMNNVDSVIELLLLLLKPNDENKTTHQKILVINYNRYC